MQIYQMHSKYKNVVGLTMNDGRRHITCIEQDKVAQGRKNRWRRCHETLAAGDKLTCFQMTVVRPTGRHGNHKFLLP